MNIHSILNDYTEIKECSYKGEHYSVRDNGAVLRHAREGKRIRKDDNTWTFGKPNENTGYMENWDRTGTSNCGFRFSWRTSHTSAHR